MKTILTLVLIFCSTLSNCQTQYEMNMDAYHSFQKADSELNAIYKKILRLYKPDIIFIKNLKKSQRIWIQFRDAEMEVKYPDYGYDFPYGSVHPMCWSLYKEQLTRTRIDFLKDWINGDDDGDVCRGSMLTPYEIKHPDETFEYLEYVNPKKKKSSK